MKRLFHLCLAAVTFFIATVALHAEEPHIARESIEWCNIWIPDANGTKLPRVLLIGDSITGATASRSPMSSRARRPWPG